MDVIVTVPYIRGVSTPNLKSLEALRFVGFGGVLTKTIQLWTISLFFPSSIPYRVTLMWKAIVWSESTNKW